MADRLVSIGIFAIVALAVVGFAAPSAQPQGEGAALYKAKCAACHGPNGKADTSIGKTLKVRDLTSDEVQKQTDAQLTAITTDGKGKMPAYKGKLTDAQIKDLIAFIRSLARK
jgi:mono/diheme cytochrome c family protein